MTAPRTFLDDPRMAKAFGLSTPAQPTGPTHPEPMNIPQTEQEMAAWMQRGGKVNPSQALGGETQTPNGLYGGEFSDEDWAAFKDAARKLDSARGAAKLAPLLERLHAASRQPSDATATPSTRKR